MKIKQFLIALLGVTLLMGCGNKRKWYTIDFPTEKVKYEADFLPISVWYSGGKARAPMLSEITDSSEVEWRRDLEQIKKLGFNTVRTWVEWAHCEPRPGEYHFENLRLLCRLAQEQDLRVIIQLYVDSAPDWVGKRYPDSRYEAQNGAKVESQAAPGFCTDDVGVRRAVLNFIKQTARVANEFPNFYGWDLWSEPHIVNWAYINYVPNVQFCYCPNTQEAFRDWLKRKYQTLTALNKAWYRNFAKWQDVTPPRFGTILSYTDFIDWKNFLYEKLAGDLRMRYEAVRSVDKTHVITSHAAVPSIFYSPYNGYGATDDFLMAQQIDFYGTSLYPKHNNPKRHWEYWKFMVAVDFSRSANRQNGGFYVGELQAGKGTIGLDVGDPITPADHRIWMWSVLAQGAKAINVYAYYPMSSGYESGGYGLINLDGSLTERAVQAGCTAQLITANRDLFLQSKPVPAQIAIVYNPLAQMVGGEQRGSAADMHSLSLISYYRTFAENNIPVDFIHRRNLESSDLSQYRLIIVPYPLMFTQKAAEGLEKFVAQGGKVLAEARLAWNDERGFAASVIPGMGLHKVFGAMETTIKMSDSVAMQIADFNHPLFKNLNKRDYLKGAYFAEALQTSDDGQSAVLARFTDGAPALIAHRYGQGETLLLGTFMGVRNHPVPDAANNRFLLNLLDWSGVERPFTYTQSRSGEVPVEIRLQENPNGYVLFIINHNHREQDIAVTLPVKASSGWYLQELLSGRNLTLTAVDSKLNLSTKIDAEDVQVWSIKSASN